MPQHGKRIWSRRVNERRNHVSGIMTLGAPPTRVASDYHVQRPAQTHPFRRAPRQLVSNMPPRMRTLEDRTRQNGTKIKAIVLSQTNVNVAKLWTRKLAQYLSQGQTCAGPTRKTALQFPNPHNVMKMVNKIADGLDAGLSRDEYANKWRLYAQTVNQKMSQRACFPETLMRNFLRIAPMTSDTVYYRGTSYKSLKNIHHKNHFRSDPHASTITRQQGLRLHVANFPWHGRGLDSPATPDGASTTTSPTTGGTDADDPRSARQYVRIHAHGDQEAK